MGDQEEPHVSERLRKLIPPAALITFCGLTAATALYAANRLTPFAAANNMPDELKALSGVVYNGALKVASVSLAVQGLGQRLRKDIPTSHENGKIVPDIDE